MKVDFNEWDNLPSLALVTITPTDAEKLLERNYKGNRHIADAWVATIATAMKENAWHPMKSQPLVFTKSGVLIDGQHRLLAVVMSGCTVEMWAQFDAEEDFVFIDGNKQRDTSGFLTNVDKYRQQVATCAGYACCIEKGSSIISAYNFQLSNIRNGSRAHLPRVFVLDYVDKHHDELLACVIKATALRDRCGKIGAPKEFALAIWTIRYLGKADMLDEFIEQFSMYTTCPQANLFKSWLLRRYAVKNRPLKMETMARIFEAFDDYCNEKVKAKYSGAATIYLEKYNELLKEKRGENYE